jgi:hypothetical protein
VTRILWFLPLAFVSGEHGFALFVPYLLAVSALAGLRPRKRVAIPIPVFSELEPAPV